MSTDVEKLVVYREKMGPLSIFTNRNNTFVIKGRTVFLLEMEDVLFHPDSCIFMPDRITDASANDSSKDDKSDLSDAAIKKMENALGGINALAVVFRELEFDPAKRILIAAHTDTKGKEDDNFNLSNECAENVLYFLTDERSKWADNAFNRQTIRDYQLIMHYCINDFSWTCNPGRINNTWNNTTEIAIDKFISEYNTKLATVKGLPVLLPDNLTTIKADPAKKWTVALWRAVYDLYSDDLMRTLMVTESELRTMRHDLRSKFAVPAKQYVGCGPSFPIDDAHKKNYRSQENRRVEILLFDDIEKPATLNCPAQKAAATHQSSCPLWNKWHRPLYIDPIDLHAVVYHVRFTYYNTTRKKWMDVPAGLQIDAYTKGNIKLKTVVKTKLVGTNTVYYILIRNANIKGRPISNLHLEFKTLNGTKIKYIVTESAGDPKLVEKEPAEVEGLHLTDRIKYYDLPGHWSSQNYWCRYDGNFNTGDRFEKVCKDIKKYKPFGNDVTHPDKPLIFSLDDIVLVDKLGNQNINDPANDSPKDKDASNGVVPLSDSSRFSLLYVKDDELSLYNPEHADAPYHTDYKFASNLITDHPADGATRMIVFANDFYHVYNRRSAQGGEPFDASKSHVRGCRVGRLEDSKMHAFEALNNPFAMKGHGLYGAAACGNYEVHYIHDACIINGHTDKLKRRSFLIIYWNGHFSSFPVGHADHATPAKVENLSKNGLNKAAERWNSKAYTIEPLTPPSAGGTCDIQIKPWFFFEAKQNKNAAGNYIGGKPKCNISVWGSALRSNMGITTGAFLWSDDTEDPHHEILDIDAKKYKWLTIAHELGHATGKDDEYASNYRFFAAANPVGGIDASYYVADDDVFSQYYLGMPYSWDKGSIMLHNTAPRMKHVWHYVNWINDEAKAGKKLNVFLDSKEFQVVHRFATHPQRLNYYLPAAPDYRDFIKPFKSKRGLWNGATGNVDIAIYKTGDDECNRSITIGGEQQSFAFDATCAVFIKICLKFVGAAWATNKKKKFIRDLMSEIDKLNSNFYLHSENKVAKFQNIYLYFLPGICENAPDIKSHFVISVKSGGGSDITRNPVKKNLEVGDEIYKPWLANYIMGQDDGSFAAFFKWLVRNQSPDEDNLKFLVEWFSKEPEFGPMTLIGNL